LFVVIYNTVLCHGAQLTIPYYTAINRFAE